MTSADAAGSGSRQERERRKRVGQFYTPEPIARYMAGQAIAVAVGGRSADSLRIVDPACGDGALLWPVYQRLCEIQRPTDSWQRLHILQRQVHGVDLDLNAVEKLRQRFRDDLGNGVVTDQLEAVLSQNFRCGNAVNGHGWEVLATADNPRLDAAFHWSLHFPEVAAGGGFDVVIANPPYRRERGAKSDLQDFAESPLGVSRHQARMDLWHYFFHRSLDLLRHRGVMAFIVNSYWTTSNAGRPLIERMAAETTPLEFVLLESAPIFDRVAGRHLILQLRQGITDERCRVVSFAPGQEAEIVNHRFWSGSSDQFATDVSAEVEAGVHCTWLLRDQVIKNGKLNFKPVGYHAVDRRLSLDSRTTLGDLFEVRQGIAENPPRVTRKQAEADANLRSGEGVFVLTEDELTKLNLSDDEKLLAKPYYPAVEISRYWHRTLPRMWLLYLTRQTAPDITALPQIERHLSRFRGVLGRRRETQQGKVAWWHLHWPREPRLFETPRILAVQMSEEPRFAFVKEPAYVGFSVNLILQRPEIAQGPSLEVLTALLNSRFAVAWFESHAKRRGVNLDITGSALRQFPLPEIDLTIAEKLQQLSLRRSELAQHREVDRAEVESLEAQINHQVEHIYSQAAADT